MLYGLGSGGLILTWPRGTPRSRATTSSRRLLYSANRSINPLMRLCGPVCGMDRTVSDTSTTASALSTPSLKSSKKRSFTVSSCAGDARAGRRTLHGQVAAVDDQLGPGDIRRLVRGQEQHSVRDLFHPSLSFHRYRLEHPRAPVRVGRHLGRPH